MPPTTPSLVALDHPPGPAWLELFEAIRARGDAVLPLDPHLGADGRQELLERMRPAELWTPTERLSLPAPLPVAEDTAVVLMTSGTTGIPKGVELSQSALDAAARLTDERLEARPGDRWLCCLPLHHVGGLGILGRAALLGTAPEIHERFDVDAVGRSAARFVSLVPTMLLRLLDAGVALDRFETILLGGARIPPRLLERARKAGGN
ncbi:MAG TPA: AMP-binding protein, partial [Actinomycetota bacterium]|nr:AMP-binding protein [Actinomycetota bacterium]